MSSSGSFKISIFTCYFESLQWLLLCLSGLMFPFLGLEYVSDSWILALPFIFQIVYIVRNFQVQKMLEN